MANKIFKQGTPTVSSIVAKKGKKPSLKARLVARLIMWLDYEPICITRKLKKTIAKFNPKYIYSLGNVIDTV